MTETETLLDAVLHDRRPLSELLAVWPSFPHRTLACLRTRVRRSVLARPTTTAAPHQLVQISRADLRKDGRYLVIASGTTAEAMLFVGWRAADRALRQPGAFVYKIVHK